MRLSVAACLFVLLAGCATLASLLLVQHERRRPEFAIRLALGCPRGALLRALMGELALVSSIGGCCALGVSSVGMAAIRALTLPGGVELSRVGLSIDWRVVTFAISALVVVTGAAGLLPLLRYSHPSLALAVIVGPTSAPLSSLRFRRVTLAVHAAATYVLVVGAVFFTQVLVRGFRVDAGFDVDQTLFVRLQASVMQGFERPADRNVAVERTLSDLRALPGVRAAIPGDAPVGAGYSPVQSVTIRTAALERALPLAVHRVHPDYARALGLRLVAGRLLERGDSPQAVLITSLLARAATDERSADSMVGQTMRLDGAVFHVVGVVHDFAQGSIRGGTPFAVITASHEELGTPSEVGLIVATRSFALAMAGPVRDLISRRFPGAARLEVKIGRELVAADLAREQVAARLFTGFGGVVVLLVLIGTFGVVEQSLRLRCRDLGIRMSLGAHPRQLMWEIARSGIQPVLAGMCGGAASVVVGTAVSGGAIITSLSPGPAVYLGAGFLLCAGAVVSAAAAAQGLFRLSPVEALRVEGR